MLIETVSPTPTEVPWAPLLSTVTAVASESEAAVPWDCVVDPAWNVDDVGWYAS